MKAVSFIFTIFVIHQKYQLKWKNNQISKNALCENQLYWLDQLLHSLVVCSCGNGTVKSYFMELRLLFQYFHHKEVEQINDLDITQYMSFIKSVHGMVRTKCRSVAQC